MISFIREKINNVRTEVRNRIDNTQNRIHASITEVQLWIPRKISEITNRLLQLLYIGLQLLIALIIVVIVSCLLYFVIKSRLVPKAVINEPVHFDYLASPPTARISLNRAEKQWSYIDHSSSIEAQYNATDMSKVEQLKSVRDKRFLKSGSKYTADMTFLLAKSANNYQQGKFMVTLTMIDSLNRPIAASVRPVIIPYQAPHVAYVDSLVQYITFPFYGRQDLVSVSLTLMNDYSEPLLHLPGTDSVEIKMSSSTFDLMETRLTLMPRLAGITYFMFYYPSVSFLLGVGLLTSIQVVIYTSTFLVALLVRHVMNGSTNSSSSSSSSGSSGSSGSADDSTSSSSEQEDNTPSLSLRYSRGGAGGPVRRVVVGAPLPSAGVSTTLQQTSSSSSYTSSSNGNDCSASSSSGSSDSSGSSGGGVNVIQSEAAAASAALASSSSAASPDSEVGLRHRGTTTAATTTAASQVRAVSPSAESVD